MNEEEKNNVQEPEKKAENKPEQLSPRRRSALVTYLAILFAVAFLFVALMMVFEAKRLKTMNQELQDSSQKTSASLTNNINALQAENQLLSKQNEDLNTRIGTLESEAAQKDGRIEELQSKQEGDAAELARLEQELSVLEEEKEAAEQRTQDAIRVSELLHKALAADEKGKLERLQELLAEIEPLEDLLSETEREIYEELKIA
ncbi:MAG: hypothetical protein II062_02530 [Oscillospiraceae bacterium]|nr:hypothetical protein [Oscillospiraceae bacterium]MBR4657237.1 hypothetical protein [Oscillospiraceae bacterium]MBR7010881.1 hypothetical protein [Oscillospiraceae bacterium]